VQAIYIPCFSAVNLRDIARTKVRLSISKLDERLLAELRPDRG